MTMRQITVLLLGAGLFVILYYYMPTTPPEKKGSPDKTAPALSEQSVLLDARKRLDSIQTKQLDSLEQAKAQASNVAQEVDLLKALSKQWYEWGDYAVSGYYAEKVADLQPTDEAWGIAGATYGEACQRSQDMQIKQYTARKAIHAFEQAKALAPDSVAYQINEALMYVELSSVDNTVPPMTGAQKLMALDKAYPNNVRIHFSLAQLSIMRSGDYKKALSRLEKLIAIPNVDTLSLLDAHYMMLTCYQELGDKPQALAQYDACIKIAAFDPELQGKLRQAKAAYEAGK